ncbi:MAG: vacuolar protein-sorting protein BRO1 [Amphiamblys sp. WSBS2006]|nr:MAG: vacuolar protein-sorting protein BRO1 [Amphiamblys sp. WSBS2006]
MLIHDAEFLFVAAKKTEPFSWAAEIDKFDGNKTDRADNTVDLRTLDRLRELASRTISSSDEEVALSNTLRYYFALEETALKLGISETEGKKQFVWEDSISGKKAFGGQVRYEQMNLLFNIGALYTHVGTKDCCGGEEGVDTEKRFRRVYKFSLKAAAVFKNINEEFQNGPFMDTSKKGSAFFYRLFKAQAEECVVLLALKTGEKPKTISKIAAETAQTYRETIFAEEEITSEKASYIKSETKDVLAMKMNYYQLVATYYKALSISEAQVGEAIGWLNVCGSLAEKLGERKLKRIFAKNTEHYREAVEAKKKELEKENDLIYHEKVPPKDVLGRVHGHATTKDVPFSQVLSEEREKHRTVLFKGVVPDTCKRNIGLYNSAKQELKERLEAEADTRNKRIVSVVGLMADRGKSKTLEISAVKEDIAELVEKAASYCEQLRIGKGVIRKSRLKTTDVLDAAEGLLREEESRYEEYRYKKGKDIPQDYPQLVFTGEYCLIRKRRAQLEERKEVAVVAVPAELKSLVEKKKTLAEYFKEKGQTPGQTVDGEELGEIKKMLVQTNTTLQGVLRRLFDSMKHGETDGMDVAVLGSENFVSGAMKKFDAGKEQAEGLMGKIDEDLKVFNQARTDTPGDDGVEKRLLEECSEFDAFVCEIENVLSDLAADAEWYGRTAEEIAGVSKQYEEKMKQRQKEREVHEIAITETEKVKERERYLDSFLAE